MHPAKANTGGDGLKDQPRGLEPFKNQQPVLVDNQLWWQREKPELKTKISQVKDKIWHAFSVWWKLRFILSSRNHRNHIFSGLQWQRGTYRLWFENNTSGELKLVLWDNLEGWGWVEGGREVQEGRDICIPMTEPCWCMAETNTIL